ncbi:hypothetical protein HDV62DRAFT_244331 [Trichoderma sp. SZMC 28011]
MYFPKHHCPFFSSQLLASTSPHIQAATALTCRQLFEYNKLPISVTYGNTSSSNWMPAKTSGPNKPNGEYRATAAGGDMERHLVPSILGQVCSIAKVSSPCHGRIRSFKLLVQTISCCSSSHGTCQSQSLVGFLTRNMALTTRSPDSATTFS